MYVICMWWQQHKVYAVSETWVNSVKRQRLSSFARCDSKRDLIPNQPKWNRPLTAVSPRRKLKLPPWAQTAPWSEWFKGGMLIRSRSIKLRKALCWVLKITFPHSHRSVSWGGQEEECVYVFLCVCSVFMYVVLLLLWVHLKTQIIWPIFTSFTFYSFLISQTVFVMFEVSPTLWDHFLLTPNPNPNPFWCCIMWLLTQGTITNGSFCILSLDKTSKQSAVVKKQYVRYVGNLKLAPSHYCSMNLLKLVCVHWYFFALSLCSN